MYEVERQAHTTVVAYLPLTMGDRPGLGLVSDLRQVVAVARRRYPELTSYQVVDVGLRREGDRVKVVLEFAQGNSSGEARSSMLQ